MPDTFTHIYGFMAPIWQYFATILFTHTRLGRFIHRWVRSKIPGSPPHLECCADCLALYEVIIRELATVKSVLEEYCAGVPGRRDGALSDLSERLDEALDKSSAETLAALKELCRSSHAAAEERMRKSHKELNHVNEGNLRLLFADQRAHLDRLVFQLNANDSQSARGANPGRRRSNSTPALGSRTT
ncbi:hypothetical protein F5Y19DRAFT_476452 [Xylariaceae sp. FL1651]|nr:hypothetical protein F5Y19DRAFT_476452 [Xylariaceae sp. FL1651]